MKRIIVNVLLAGLISAPVFASETAGISAKQPHIDSLRAILVKLVRLDEQVQTALVDSRTLRTGSVRAEIVKVSAELTNIERQMAGVVSETKTELIQIPSFNDAEVRQYTRTVVSYTGRLRSRVNFIYEGILKVYSTGNRGPKMRDALSPVPGAGGGVDLKQIARSGEASSKLVANVKKLKTTSDKLNAAGRWMYLISK